MSKRVLYIPCYSGELGWELINYVPHVNYVFKQHTYNEVHCVVRVGREALYPMATHFYPINLSTKKSMGNNGVSPPKNSILQSLQKTNKTVDVISVFKGGCKLAKRRKYLKYQADKSILDRWDIPDNAVVFCVRGRSFGVHKNWSVDNWKKLIDHILSNNFVPVITGIKELVNINLPLGCIDVQSQTNLEDLLAIMQKSKFAIGGSTGPLHFASLAEVPHAVWGSSRIQERYLKSWNPHHTKVEYHICSKGEFNCPIDEALALADKMIGRLR